MKAYRRGEMIRTDVPWRPDCETGLWWFLGRHLSTRYVAGVLAHYRYRGEHRADQFSIRVAEIQEHLAKEPVATVGPWEVQADGTLVIRGLTIRIPDRDATGVAMVSPSPAVTNFPALVAADD